MIHLLFRTKRFGVNNQWWNSFDSMFGVGNLRKIYDILTLKQILNNYRMMKFRAKIGFLSYKDYDKIFG